MDSIQYEEQFCVLFLNRANRAIGIHRHSVGGIAGTVVDVKQVLGVALKCNASSFILCHNHPYSNRNPSQADITLTQRIKKAAEAVELTLLDHLIITHDGYYSFVDEGQL